MDDLISRQAAIDAIKNTYGLSYIEDGFNRQDAVSILENLPSAQPELIRCKDCRNNHWCNIQEAAMAGDNFFCGAAERRIDE